MPAPRSRSMVLAGLLALGACAAGSPSPSLPEHSVPASRSASPEASPSTGEPSPSESPPSEGAVRLALELVAEGFAAPVGIANAGDGRGRLFVVERAGTVQVVNDAGQVDPAPFVDLTDLILSGSERGLLGLAFHPAFEANGRLFVDFTRRDDGATVIAELSSDGERADPASLRVLLVIAQPYPNHNGGQLAFGPDGYLYIGMGDGGSADDPLGHGQRRDTLLGKILRIDVDAPPSVERAYAIPADNPYAEAGIDPGAGEPEIWAVGLRNPWRFSFDRGTGDLYIGDVGQDHWEEIDRQPAGSAGGENYGWNIMEGAVCRLVDCIPAGLVRPMTDYSHSVGCSITGGYVYRGLRYPALVGWYLFGDYCSGDLMLVPAAEGVFEPLIGLSSGMAITSFGEGEDGELYLVDLNAGGLQHVVVSS